MAAPGPVAVQHEKVSDLIPFHDFAKLLERISEASTSAIKTARLQKFLNGFRDTFKRLHGSLDTTESHGDSIFCLIRLLLPNRDRERASYGIKSTVWARMFAKIMGLDTNSSDYKKLVGFKNPEAAGTDTGNLSTVIQGILEFRSKNVPDKGPTISELHSVLDQLARDKYDKGSDEDPVTQEKQIKILQGFVRRIKPIEGKWLTRIILKHLDLGLTEGSILKLVHIRARDLLNTTGMKEVCLRLNDPETVLIGTGLSLFNFFTNMLCLRFNIEEEEEASKKAVTAAGPSTSKKKTKDPITLPPSPFTIETKWDGERFQIHYQRDPGTGRHIFKYYSRNNFEFTNSFSETLSPRLAAQLVESPLVTSFMIDGEMMAWNYAKQCFTQKGHSIDVKRMNNDNVNHCPAFVAYDIVYYNGQDLIDRPLKERMELLKQVLLPKEAVYYISEKKLGSTMEDVMVALDEAITNSEEGVILKDIESKYHPGKRFACWLKLKPEYVHSCQIDDLDLLILGGYYSESVRRGGAVTSLLLGLIDNEDELYPITSVGCGKLKHPEMESLVNSLQPFFVKTEIPGVKFKGRKRPDLFIDPSNSVIVQVKASEILYSKEYAINYSLRFPRIISVRRDKPWSQGMTVKEFHDLRISCKGKLVKNPEPGSSTAGALVPANGPNNNGYFDNINEDFNFSSSDDETAHANDKGRKRTKRKLASGPAKSPLKGIQLKAKKAVEEARVKLPDKAEENVFQGRVFNVIGTYDWRLEMEARIKTFGGDIVRNTTEDTFCIIAEKDTSQTVVNKKREGLYDIVRPSWVTDCIQQRVFRLFIPKDLYFAKAATQTVLYKSYDEYGDHYTERSSLPQIRELVQRVIQTVVIPEEEPSASEMAAIKRRVNEELFHGHTAKLKKWSFFSDCRVAFRGGAGLIPKSMVQFYGGTVVEDEDDDGVTHVILPAVPASPPRGSVQSHPVAYVMKRAWLDRCLERKVLVTEFSYMVE